MWSVDQNEKEGIADQKQDPEEEMAGLRDQIHSMQKNIVKTENSGGLWSHRQERGS